MYWSGIECGLAIIAACLPKLSYLFGRFSVQSAVRSVRSVFSLNSLNSATRSQTSSRGLGNEYVDIESSSKTSSKGHIHVEHEIVQGTENISMDDVKVDRPAEVFMKP
jgi:hypothetical protein